MSLKPKQISFKQTWEVLQETIKCIITSSNVPHAVWNDRFSDIYSLCVAYPESFAEELYNETKKFLEGHVFELLTSVCAESESGLLQAYRRAWCEYSQGTDHLHHLYSYLNQHHIRRQKFSEAELIYGTSSSMTADYQEQMVIGELGLDIWKRGMITPLKKQLVSQLLECIHADRVGKAQTANTEVIWSVIHSFVQVEQYKLVDQLKMYQTIFEAPFLEASGQFYTNEAFTLRQKSNITYYMEKVTTQFILEELRAHKFLHTSSVPKVKLCFEEKMIATYMTWLHTEAESMIQNERKSDLSLLYPLLRPLPGGLTPVVQKLTEHITAQGLKAIGNLQGENVHTQFVENMLDVHKKYSKFIKDVFNDDLTFMAALDKACSAIVNHRTAPRQPVKAPELLAKYCDSLLRKSAKAASEVEVEEKLASCITVFKYVDDKDVFQKFYAPMLAKRLIHQQSQSMDAEESMIERLKQACGYEFTNKLHRMFTDMSVSADLNAKFTASLREGDRENQLRIGFVVYVLQAGAWPLALPPTSGPFHIPQQLEKSIQSFEAFYHAQFSGRKVTWLHHLCQGELKFNYLKKPYLVVVQTYQMALLLLFEHCNSIQCREAAASLHLSHDQLVKHAASLVDSKILKKSTEGELEEDTVLSLNFDYSNKRMKFRITGALQRDVPHENHDTEATHRSVDEDRKLYLQAAIVRIMKSRKVLRHNQLIQEVLSQPKVTFTPSIGMIKKCIEALIDKQYIERTPNNADEYSYVA
ncbi:cullin 2 [Nomia melanderi]|uniref:cullin 2 n=1 Tax=Nomia melanderi TaxID=2448451 RepID=UPI0013043D7F|nr:cullin-2 [Nomia melanderi]XP_031832848.1 cullin-2 [Nomia melanderi]XP_031832849.1 cullin-2 [Nomia melanderi]XP_031832850.1 cullin-2 [Nomia melanderi]XP_031832851.1 cullin-2 [Nomia melanderi]XP_031832852.1 cullin-2 [Nomia melanderi]XP_031832853.1 cullin-2 [Nomia melanderi]XP_031832854.1 cullin-2 [Nomia melanderi]XP_031832855.1 cullin-2 [Nomia melanderi]XP_031832856.1 cullin-2 [Nomia melanderi]XP_031832857.1 cullin-2 [Nomia melanderi]XP_031832858.1 cullin-2 [Nomia melanderi]XP_03183285